MSDALVQAVLKARSDDRKLSITGLGSKKAWLGEQSGEMLTTADYSGIVDYQPGELVVTARAGTPLKHLQLELEQGQQLLGADPPQYSGSGTVGGAVAAGFSGPGRVWCGSMSDAVLGVTLLTGRGEVLKFGGQVMKNVAGYDVSRLLTGSFGALGLLLEVSLRVRPKSENELTLQLELDGSSAIQRLRTLALKPYPITATFWQAGVLSIRLSGPETALHSARQIIGGEALPEADNFWTAIRDHQYEFFRPASPDHHGRLVRVIVPPASPMPADDWPAAVEWGGGLRWFWHEEVATVQQYASEHGGWCWAYGEPVPISAGLRSITQEVKRALDPDSVFVAPWAESQHAD